MIAVRRLAGLAVLALIVCPGLLTAVPYGPFPAAARPTPPRQKLSSDQLADRSVHWVEARLAATGVKPAPAADDAEYLRRVSLDLGGRAPRVAAAREFLDDPSPGKRKRAVDGLLDGPQYVRHFTHVWRTLLLPPNNQQAQYMTPGFEAWLHDRVRDNVGYDKLVRELLTLQIAGSPRALQEVYSGRPSPFAFYLANEQKPENLAASASRLFLGVKLECAQCHNHPFARYTRKQFWEQAAFFANLQQPPQAQQSLLQAIFAPGPRPSLRIPGTDKTVFARYLDDTDPNWKNRPDPRAVLADWVTSPKNPYFARTLANRLWAQCFGLGLTEPVDEPGDDNPPSHPDLLDELSKQLAAHDFDVKYLLRAITASRAYGRSSAGPAADPRLFARMAVKGLTPEQLFESLSQATGYREPPGQAQQFFGANTPRSEFVAKFAGQEKRTEYQTSILHALALMNGRLVGDATSLDRSETLAAVVDAPFLDDAGRVETLYLAALARRPRPEESAKMLKYVAAGGARSDRKAALADVFWALLNSPEFRLNH